MPTFRWTCSYMGCAWYEVSDHTGTYEVQLRHHADDYELSIANGDDVRRDMKAAIGLLHRSGRSWEPIPCETVDAFNAWRLSERAKHIAEMQSQPHRYGDIDPNDTTLFPPIMPVRGAVYVVGPGWQASA